MCDQDKLKLIIEELSTPIFGEKENISKAFEYVSLLSSHSQEGAYIMTAVGIMCNTIAKELRKLLPDEFYELTHAEVSGKETPGKVS
jgi:hypothetical protein